MFYVTSELSLFYTSVTKEVINDFQEPDGYAEEHAQQ